MRRSPFDASLARRLRHRLGAEASFGVGRAWRPRGLMARARLRREGVRLVGIHGGLGDLFLLAPFLRRAKAADPRRKLVAMYPDASSAAPDPATLSYHAVRRMRAADGRLVNPMREILEALPFVDDVVGGDLSDPRVEYWFPPVVAARAGGYARPDEFEEVARSIVGPEQRARAKTLRADLGLDGKEIVVVHYRRSAAQLHALHQRLVRDEGFREAARVVVVGSRDHEIIPSLDLPATVDLTDNHAKGVALRELLALTSEARLFLGGRGGFELFHWYARVPSVNVFDEEAVRREIPWFWPRFLWEENAFPDLVTASTFDADSLAARILRHVRGARGPE